MRRSQKACKDLVRVFGATTAEGGPGPIVTIPGMPAESRDVITITSDISNLISNFPSFVPVGSSDAFQNNAGMSFTITGQAPNGTLITYTLSYQNVQLNGAVLSYYVGIGPNNAGTLISPDEDFSSNGVTTMESHVQGLVASATTTNSPYIDFPRKITVIDSTKKATLSMQIVIKKF